LKKDTQKQLQIFEKKLMARPQQNNNPFALIQLVPDKWQGLVGAAADGFLKFQSPTHGVRAGFINLFNTYLEKGYNTINTIFLGDPALKPVYAPAGHGDNNPEAYAAHVAQLTGIDRNAPIQTEQQIYKLGRAIVQHEEGNFWVSETDFNGGFKLALEKKKQFVKRGPCPCCGCTCGGASAQKK
jgi:hypothetical protein